MTMKPASALEAFAHCCTETQVRAYLGALSESGRERLKTHGHLALSRAMEFNKDSAGVIRALLEQPEIQVNLPHVGQDGNTVLHFAVLLRDAEAVRMLLARDDIDTNVGNRRGGRTPLHIAVEEGSSCLEILELLLADLRVNVAAVTTDKRTVLHVACTGGGSCSVDRVDVVSRLLKFLKAETKLRLGLPQFLKSTDVLGRTALHYAAESGLAETVDEFLNELGPQERSNASIDHLALAEDINRYMAVHLAVQKGHLEVVKRLLPLIDSKLDQSRETAPLHAFRILSRRKEEGKGGSSMVLDIYLKLLDVVSTDDSSIANYLLETLYKTHFKQPHIEVSDHKDCPRSQLLLWAVKFCKDTDHLPLLISHILKWNLKLANKRLEIATKRTILHIATISENRIAVQALCKESALWDLDGNRRDANDKTALEYAFENENKTIQHILMGRQDVKEHLAGLHRKRATYAQASNAILVVAALICTVTYMKCTTKAELDKLGSGSNLAPSPSLTSRKGTDYLEYATMPTRLAFLLAIVSCLLAAFAALPFSFGLFFVQTTDDSYIRRSLYRTRVLIVVSSYCLVLSLGAFWFAFICSQYISPFFSYECAFACKVALIVFVCLSVVFLATNGVTALWSKEKERRKELLRTDESMRFIRLPKLKGPEDV
ncbi:hypothetical protein KC19_10G182600 [Ceratodon purpureus]|uniref:PGG domain-containing protein n=1 Tax=Ceratodon purpureus TaxID=3225 RepID=A0A8T0GNF5_CERPU|nr:hypothetical protein KC19_10G182600 [Ceratodon purpureus]